MQEDESQIAEGDRPAGADQHEPRRRRRGDPRERGRTDEQAEDVRADDVRGRGGGQAEPVPVHPRICTDERRQRPLRAQQRDADEGRGEEHRPQGRLRHEPHVDQRRLRTTLQPHEPHDDRDPDQNQPHDPDGDARDPHQAEAAGDREKAEGEYDGAAGVDTAAGAFTGVGHEAPHDDQRDGDQRRGDGEDRRQVARPRDAELPRDERPSDRAELEGHDDDAGRATGEAGRVGQSPGPRIDDRHVQRQPDHIEALHREHHEEQRERRRERHPPRPERRDGERPDEHAPMPVHVTQAREDRYDDRGQQELYGLEPVDVGVVDGQPSGDVGEQRRVEALDHAGCELDDGESPDHAPRERCALGHG